MHNVKILACELAEPLAEAEIIAVDKSGTRKTLAIADENGQAEFPEDGANYAKIIISKNGYFEKSYDAKDVLPTIVRLLCERIVAYQNKLWFLPDEEIDVFANCANSFTAKLYRHGFEKAEILDLGKFKAQEQRLPDGYFVANGLDWQKSLQYKIPKKAKPGIYSLLLEDEKGEKFAIPMIVSTPPEKYGKSNKILLLASTNTWQSYNVWGGRSRYRNFETGASKFEVTSRLPKGADLLKNDNNAKKDTSQKKQDFNLVKRLKQALPIGLKRKLKILLGREDAHKIFVTPNHSVKNNKKKTKVNKIFRCGENKNAINAWMFERLSVRRPFNNCALEEDTPHQPFCNHLAAGEWRLAAWLEREGIDYDLVSGAELHRNPDLLKNYKSIILSTHCEYWSKEMYDGLKKYHQKNGLWILNISGNSIYREIIFHEDGSTQCVSLRFHLSCADETELLGVRYTSKSYSLCAQYKILEPDHWIFNNCHFHAIYPYFGAVSLNQNTPYSTEKYNPGRPGGKYSLIGSGASGWEIDILNKEAPKDMKVVARGCNVGAASDMIVREAKGIRGGMFTASSICFSACLLVDAIASQVVKNVLKKVNS